MKRLFVIAAVAVSAFTSSVWAHFPFVVPSKDNPASARVVFSETLLPDDEVPMSALKGFSILARRADGTDQAIEPTASPLWLDVVLPVNTRLVHGLADLGFIQRGSGVPHVLIYHPKTILGDPFDASATLGSAPVEIVPVRGKGGFQLKLIARGESVGERKIMVIAPDGTQEEYDLDANGMTETLIQPGQYGAWARHWLDKPGERGGKQYKQERHYATIVFTYEESIDAAVTPNEPAMPFTATAAPFKLPQTLASFGAAESEGYLYVFGGHVIDRHEYHTKAVTGDFRRIRLDGSSTWEDLPGTEMGMQGMNIIAHEGKIYRVGGMQPRNAPDEDTDNISLAELSCFDPATKQWSTLAAPPNARSSHDLAIVGSKLYVLGGWDMKGTDQGESWLNKACVLDLSNPSSTWTSIDQPWARRALIVAASDSKIYVMGGIDEHNDIHRRVDVLDVETGTWSQGPDIPGSERNGFAPAACVVDGRVYLSVPSGEVYRLNEQRSDWELLAKATPRQVHRMVVSGGKLYIIGGAMRGKMTDLIESVDLSADSQISRRVLDLAK